MVWHDDPEPFKVNFSGKRRAVFADVAHAFMMERNRLKIFEAVHAHNKLRTWPAIRIS
jgi:hypothetical protein